MGSTVMMDAAGITDTTDRLGLRDLTEQMILTLVAQGWDFQDATIEFAENVRDMLVAAGLPEVANGMGRLVAEIGADFGARLIIEASERH